MRRAFQISSMVIAAVIGFAGGSWLAFDRRLSALSALAAGTSGEPADEFRVESKPAYRSMDDAASAVFGAHLEADMLHRGFALYEALAGLSAEQVGELVQRVSSFPASQRKGLLGPLLRRWQELDPDAAEAWARPALERAFAGPGVRGLDQEILFAWTEAAPERALAEALRRPHSRMSEHVIWRSVQALSGTNAQAQIERLSGLPPGRMRDRALRTCLSEWAKQDAASAYAQISHLPAGAERDQARMNILSEWAKVDSRAALGRLRDLLPELQAELQGNPLLNRVLGDAASHDPRGAAAFAATLPRSMRIPAIVSALNGWIRQDPIAALEWARDQGIPLDSRGANDDLHMFAHTELIRGAVSVNGEKVIEWLRRLPAGGERDRLLGLAAQSAKPELAAGLFHELPSSEQLRVVGLMAWGKGNEDPDAAVRWAREMSSPEVRAAALARVVPAYAERFPSKLDALLESLPAGRERDAALRGCASGIAWRDPEKALAFAERITTSNVREQAFRIVARSWLSHDKPAATAWLAQTPELSAATKANYLRDD